MYMSTLSKKPRVWLASLGIVFMFSFVYQLALPNKVEAGLVDTVIQVTDAVQNAATPSSGAAPPPESSNISSSASPSSTADASTESQSTDITSAVSSVVSEVVNTPTAESISITEAIPVSSGSAAEPTATMSDSSSEGSSSSDSSGASGFIPGLQVTTPSISINTSIFEVEIPSVEAGISDDGSSGASIHIPEMKVEAPAVQVQIPSVQTQVPIVPDSLPHIQVQTSSVQVSTPQIEIEIPSVSLEIVPEEAIVPLTRTEIPKAEVPRVEIPGIQIERSAQPVITLEDSSKVSLPDNQAESTFTGKSVPNPSGQSEQQGNNTNNIEIGQPETLRVPEKGNLEPPEKMAEQSALITDKPFNYENAEDTGDEQPALQKPALAINSNGPNEVPLALPQPKKDAIALLYVAAPGGNSGTNTNGGGVSSGAGSSFLYGNSAFVYSEATSLSPVEFNFTYDRFQLLGSNQWSQPPPGQPPQTLSSHSTVF